MANWDTFADLKDRVRDQLADHTDSFFKEAEIGVAINEGERELFKILQAQQIGLFFDSTPIQITLSTSGPVYDLGVEYAGIDEIMATDDANRHRRFDFRSRHSESFRSLRSLPASQTYDSDSFLFDTVSATKLMIVPNPSTSFSIDVYIFREPGVMVNAGDVPTVKDLFRNWIVQYAVLLLKGKEEAGEQISHRQLLDFLTTSASNYIANRAQTNHDVVEEFEG